MACAVSGKKATCSLAKGKYIYLRAFDPADPKQLIWVKEEHVLNQLTDVLRSFRLADDLMEKVLDYNIYYFGVTSTATGFSEAISWNPTNGQASVVLTPTAGGSAITTSIGQINPGNVLSVSGPYITIASSSGAAIASTTVNSDGSTVNNHLLPMRGAILEIDMKRPANR